MKTLSFDLICLIHQCASANAYNITVNGCNLLSNVTVSLGDLFYVQVTPSGLKLDRARYFVPFGNASTFNVTLQEGTDVKYSWNMGDGQVYATDSKCDLLP